MKEITVFFVVICLLLFVVGGWIRSGVIEKLEQIRLEIVSEKHGR